MKPTPKFRREPFNLHGSQSGFSLVELMIGLTLGLLAAVAIFASLVAFEKQRRTTGGGADMQQNGLLAMYALEQDTRDAGYGLIDSSSRPGTLPCTTINAYLPTLVASGVGAAATWAPVAGVSSTFNSSPVVIADGGANSSDTITLHRFDSDTGGIVTGGQATTLTAPVTSAPAVINVATEKPFHINDFILIADNGNCGLLQVTGSLASTLSTQAVDNPAGTPTTPAPSATYATSASVINLGQPASSVPGVCPLATTTASGNRVGELLSDQVFARACSAPTFDSSLYAVNPLTNELELTRNGGISTAVASNIVDMQVQYGVSDLPSVTIPHPQPVTCWTDATGSGCNATAGSNWNAPVHADVVRIKAIRVAILARSAKDESETDGTCKLPAPNLTSWTTPTTTPASSTAPSFTVPAADCYRYKAYQTIIPLRNVVWGRL